MKAPLTDNLYLSGLIESIYQKCPGDLVNLFPQSISVFYYKVY